jgi:hypothetical protein
METKSNLNVNASNIPVLTDAFVPDLSSDDGAQFVPLDVQIAIPIRTGLQEAGALRGRLGQSSARLSADDDLAILVRKIGERARIAVRKMVLISGDSGPARREVNVLNQLDVVGKYGFTESSRYYRTQDALVYGGGPWGEAAVGCCDGCCRGARLSGMLEV